MPKTRCPAAYVPDVNICDPAELDPLVDFLSSKKRVESATAFSRGTLLPDGRLDLCKQSIGPEGTRRVLDALAGTRVRSILLGTDAIGSEGAKAVGEFAASDESELETLYLGCNCIDGDAARGLTEPLAKPVGVKALWLKRNPLGESGAGHIATLLGQNAELEILDVFNCELGDAGIVAIADRADSLRALIIGGNGASRAGAEALADLLGRTSKLEDLNLGASPLGDDGAEALAVGIANNKSLVRLNISSCSISPRGARALMSAIANHPRLAVVDAARLLASRALGEADNAFGDDVKDHVAIALRDAPELRSFDLRNAGVTSRGALELEAILQARTDIAYLGLARFVSRRIRRRIAALLERNHELGARVPERPAYVAAIDSVYRNPPQVASEAPAS